MATSEFTQLMRQWQADDGEAPTALDALVELVDGELRRLARHYLQGERAGHTLQTTALVNEVWLRVLASDDRAYENRSHFIAVAASTMRHILVDWGRKRCTLRNGGGAIQVSLSEANVIVAEDLTNMVALNEALTRLEAAHPQAAEVFLRRYFGGFQNKEVAESLGLTEVAATRHWNFAQAWLKRALAGKEGAR